MLLSDFAVVDLDPAELARLDPGGPDEPPRWWMDQWRQEFEADRPAVLEPEPEPDETVASLAAYAAHRERGLSPGAAAYAATRELEAAEMEAG